MFVHLLTLTFGSGILKDEGRSPRIASFLGTLDLVNDSVQKNMASMYKTIRLLIITLR